MYRIGHEFSYTLKNIFNFIFELCVYVSGYICTHVCEFSGRPETFNSSGAEFQEDACYLMWALGTKFWSFARTVPALKPRPISPQFFSIKKEPSFIKEGMKTL